MRSLFCFSVPDRKSSTQRTRSKTEDTEKVAAFLLLPGDCRSRSRRSRLLGMWEFPAGAASNQFRSLEISWPPSLTEKARGWLFPVRRIPVCRFVRLLPQRLSSVGCPVGNQSSHRRSSQARNELTEWENTGRPATRSLLCNIPAANSGRKDECGRPATNQFEDTLVVLGGQLTRTIFTTELGVPKVAFSIEFRRAFPGRMPPASKASKSILCYLAYGPTSGLPCVSFRVPSSVATPLSIAAVSLPF